MEENRKKALAAALSQIEKQFGKGSVMRLGDAGATYEVDSIPTGSLGLISRSASAASRAGASLKSLAGIFRQDYPHVGHHRIRASERRNRRIRGRGTCA